MDRPGKTAAGSMSILVRSSGSGPSSPRKLRPKPPCMSWSGMPPLPRSSRSRRPPAAPNLDGRYRLAAGGRHRPGPERRERPVPAGVPRAERFADARADQAGGDRFRPLVVEEYAAPRPQSGRAFRWGQFGRASAWPWLWVSPTVLATDTRPRPTTLDLGTLGAPAPLPMAHRRIRACSVPSTIHAPRQTDPAFLALLRGTLLGLKREQFERAFETASTQAVHSADHDRA